MPDSPAKRGKPDRIRIAIGQSWERVYWSKAFGITQLDLRAIVEKVGPMVADVKRYLIERIEQA